MKKFIKNIFFFILPVIALSITVELMLRNIPNDYKNKNEYLSKNGYKIKNIIFGSSHAFRGLDPKYFLNTTYNAAYISQSLNYDYKIFQKFENKLSNLDFIILTVSPISLYYDLNYTPANWRASKYKIYYKIRADYKLKNNLELLSALPLVNYKNLKSYYYNNQVELEADSAGSGANFALGDSSLFFDLANEIVLRHTTSNSSKINKKIFTKNINIITQFNNYALENSINILYLLMPAHHTYYNNDNLNSKFYIELNQIIDDLKKDNANIHKLDLFRSELFKNEDFYDPDHLSNKGAEKLSKLVNRYIEEVK